MELDNNYVRLQIYFFLNYNFITFYKIFFNTLYDLENDILQMYNFNTDTLKFKKITFLLKKLNFGNFKIENEF